MYIPYTDISIELHYAARHISPHSPLLTRQVVTVDPDSLPNPPPASVESPIIVNNPPSSSEPTTTIISASDDFSQSCPAAGLSSGSVAGIVIGSIVGTLFIVWLIYFLRGTKGVGYTHGGAEAGAGTGKRYSGYDEKGHRRHRKEYIGTETYVPAGSRRGSTYEARERAPSRHQSVYEGRETAVVGGGRRGSVYEGRERSRGRREDTYESVEKTARPVRPERVVYRD